jgi:hypothetical protein
MKSFSRKENKLADLLWQFISSRSASLKRVSKEQKLLNIS